MKPTSAPDVLDSPTALPVVGCSAVVRGRSNPKRLAELTESLHNLRDMARLESSCCGLNELAARKVWREIEDWADGTAAKYKLNLDSVPVALKKHTANAGMESSNISSSATPHTRAGERTED